jgi:hypothetical protein
VDINLFKEDKGKEEGTGRIIGKSLGQYDKECYCAANESH